MTVLSAQPAHPAETLMVNGNIVSLHPFAQPVDALAVRGERIVWLGPAGEGRSKFPGAKLLDLGGATVLPGLIDAHTHLRALGESLMKLNLKGVRTPEEAVDLVRKRVKTARPGEWIVGWGWDEGAWASHYPDNKALSQAAPNNPVVLTGLHTFATWANRRALQTAGITRETKDPPNGKILRDAAGEPSGVLTDRAQTLLNSHIPPPTPERRKHAMELAAQECVRLGLTEVHEAGVGAADLTALRELIRQGKMPLRIYAMLDGADAGLIDAWMKKGPELDPRQRLTVRAVKVFADGALGSRGAALLAPYGDKPDTKGLMTTSQEQIYALTRRCLEHGFQVCTHAIGDAANRAVLDAYQRALREVPSVKDARLRIEHAQVLSPEDVPRFQRLGVIPSMQPTHCTSDMGWAEQRLGPVRVRLAYAWRSLRHTGVHLPLSSDFPGESPNPLEGMYAAATRQDPSGNPRNGWYSAEKLSPLEAVRGYTLEAAYAAFEENLKGSLAADKLADFTVLSGDPQKLPPTQWLRLRVLMTVVGGKVVYDGRAHTK